jgi:CHASE2 domain-containing sensor protein
MADGILHSAARVNKKLPCQRVLPYFVATVKLNAFTRQAWFVPAVGAAVTMFCGFVLHQIPLGEKWENASYDYLFRFGSHATTNVVLITMDSAAYTTLGQSRGQWDRSLHAKLLQKLAEDKCPLAVFDVFLDPVRATTNDDALASAMRREGHVVLMEKTTEPNSPSAKMHQVLSPQSSFVRAAAGLGIGEIDDKLWREPDQPPRRHFPFPSPGDRITLPWAAAELSGARLSPIPEERWLRYYGERGGWTKLSYQYALTMAPGYFSNKVVFIGQEPEQEDPSVPEVDKFRTPYTRWNGKAVGGVEIHATTYLNLMQGDWLRRVPAWGEMELLAVAGLLLGGSLCLVRRPAACVIAVVVFCGLTLVAVCLGFYTNYWFDWMTVAGGQLPVALSWALAAPVLRRKPLPDQTLVQRRPAGPAGNLPRTDPPDAPDYQLCDLPFGSGAYGRVWLARNAIGQWQALKAVYLSGFGEYTAPYDREFNGISRYKPVSEKHSGLLRIDFISQKKPGGYFYYVMELGDSLTPGWEKDPSLYQPRDLAAARNLAEGRRLPSRECIRICMALCEALQFLHSQGLTHRDIKPGNIIFVNGQPKLADVGLIAEIRPNPSEQTWVGTPAYMPPPPEPPGTVQADIYGLGMVLYVIRTGRDPEFFPGVSTTLAEQGSEDAFLPLNTIILKACQPDIAQRYASAAEMQADLVKVRELLDQRNG